MARKLKYLLPLFSFLYLVAGGLRGQELNCTVHVSFDQIPGRTIDQTIVQQLQTYISDLFNKRAWTTDRFSVEEKIKCQFKDRKSTRLNSSHVKISYAVFCLK